MFWVAGRPQGRKLLQLNVNNQVSSDVSVGAADSGASLTAQVLDPARAGNVAAGAALATGGAATALPTATASTGGSCLFWICDHVI